MAAVACLRVLADGVGSGHSDGLVAVVAKLTSAFLDSRWVWPRRHGRVGPSAFLLADPRALEFDAEELRNLARELQVKLFGVEGAGEVSLLLFEGEQSEITRFATCDTKTLIAALEGTDDTLPLNGRLRRVTAAGVEPVLHKGDPTPEAVDEPTQPTITPEALLERVQDAERPAQPTEAAAPIAGFHAVYYMPRGNVVGSAVSDAQLGASSLRGIFGNAGYLQGEAARRYDERCIEASLPVLAKPFAGLLFFPISYSSIVHRPTRELYATILRQLPADRHAQLATAVYDVPRDPSFTAVSQLTTFLKTYFSFIDLQVLDPAFQVDKLAVGSVNSVTLVLTAADPKQRISSVRRLMDNREAYKRRQIWPAVTHIRNRSELDFCLAQRAPFVSGPAVSDLLDFPAPAGSFSSDALPVRRAVSAPAEARAAGKAA